MNQLLTKLPLIQKNSIMKKLFLIPVFFVVFYSTNYAQTTIDSTGVKLIIKAINNQTEMLKDSIKTKVVKCNAPSLKPNGTVTDILVFLPAALFLLIFISTFIKLKRDNVKLSDFLIDKDAKIAIKKEETAVATVNAKAAEATADAIKANAPAFLAAGAVPPQVQQPGPVKKDINQGAEGDGQSTSRLVAFISGITSVGLAACITSFYFYRVFLGDTAVDISALSTVLYGLGLGTIPYGFNKIANAVK